MNAFGIKNNRFQQKALNKKQQSKEKLNTHENQQQQKFPQQIQNESDRRQNRKESITVVSPTTPISEFHVPIFQPAKFIYDITNKKQ
ncbi:unnamed protein product [Paramecium pentaurelia]|uniref:Uncharacterized protein n=1 Tax=Paramecium pentaurelia TaxID=43138 RepID=A0A8S1SMM6_9CILI|nr:unnamed protein product [Paramecium pentaurelia]